MEWKASSVQRKPRKRSQAARELAKDSLLKLPPPIIDRWDWQLGAACRGMDSALFFAPDGERARARNRRTIKAKAICNGCPALQDCRNYAIASGETSGIWGGLTEDERASNQQLTSTA